MKKKMENKSNTQLLMLGPKGLIESGQRTTSISDNCLTKDPAFQKLKHYYDEIASKMVMNDLFNNDTKRFDKFQ